LTLPVTKQSAAWAKAGTASANEDRTNHARRFIDGIS
jgi:hypothetical protein